MHLLLLRSVSSRVLQIATATCGDWEAHERLNWKGRKAWTLVRKVSRKEQLSSTSLRSYWNNMKAHLYFIRTYSKCKTWNQHEFIREHVTCPHQTVVLSLYVGASDAVLSSMCVAAPLLKKPKVYVGKDKLILSCWPCQPSYPGSFVVVNHLQMNTRTHTHTSMSLESNMVGYFFWKNKNVWWINNFKAYYGLLTTLYYLVNWPKHGIARSENSYWPPIVRAWYKDFADAQFCVLHL